MKLIQLILSLTATLSISILSAQDYYYSATTLDSSGKEKQLFFYPDGNPVFNKSWDWVYSNYWNWIICRENDQLFIFDSTGTRLKLEGIERVHTVWKNSLYIPLKKDGLWGYYDRKGKLVIKHRYDDICLFEDGIAAVKEGKETYYINTKGKRIDKPYVYDNNDFTEAEAAVGMFGFSGMPQVEFEQFGKIGLKEKATDKIIIPAVFEGFYNLQNNQVTVELNGKYGVLDFDGSVLIPIIYEEVILMD